MDATREAYVRGLWEQQVIRWLYRTQPKERAELVLLGYMMGRADAKALFELASDRMQRERHRAS